MALYGSPEYQTSLAFQFRKSSSKYIFKMMAEVAILNFWSAQF